MPHFPIEREIAFIIKDVSRMLGTFADQQGRVLGVSRAQWTVLVRLERTEGLKQSELAEILDMQPISLTRMLDRLAENGLIERRPDLTDRRVNRLYLKPAARPLLEKLAILSKTLTATVLEGLDATAMERMLRDLTTIKDNLRAAIARNANQTPTDKVLVS